MQIRIVFILMAFIFLSLLGFGQDRVCEAKKMTKQGYTMQKLDSIYKNGLPVSDTLHPLFTQVYYDSIVAIERIELLKKMSNYFNNHNLKWKPSVNIWTRIYCDTTGEVNYLFYHFMRPIDSIKEKEFKVLANNFLRKNKLSVFSTQKFSLCGRITWKDN